MSKHSFFGFLFVLLSKRNLTQRLWLQIIAADYASRWRVPIRASTTFTT